MLAEQTFTKEDTKMIKGAAVVLMLLHHLWGFPDRLPKDMQLADFGIMVYGEDLMFVTGAFGKICVSLFMFLGGYGLWKKTRNSYSLASDIIRLYAALWKVAVVFIPIGLLFFSNQPDYAEAVGFCHVFDNAALKNIVNNFMGLSASYNKEWWFFQVYLGALFMGYIFISVDKVNNFYLDAFIVVLVRIITQGILPVMFPAENYRALNYDLLYKLLIAFKEGVCVFFMGIIFAKYDALARMKERYRQTVKMAPARLAAAVIGIAVIFLCRQLSFGSEYDIIYVPFLILFFVELFGILKPLGKMAGVIGKHSTNMWLIHSFYCYYYYSAARLVCWSQNAFAALLTLVVMSFFSSVMLDWGFQQIKKIL